MRIKKEAKNSLNERIEAPFKALALSLKSYRL